MSLPIPQQEVQDRAKKVVEEFVDYSKTKRDEKIKHIDELHDNYTVKEKTGNYPGRAKNNDSFSHEAVETIVPRIFEVLTQNGHLKYEVSPVEFNDEDLTRKANALIAHDLKMAKGRKKLVEGTRYIAKYGTGIFYTPWVKDVRRRLKPKYSIKGVKYEDNIRVYQEVLEGYEITETPIHEGVGLELVDLRSVYLDPFEPDPQKAQAVVHENNIAFEALEREAIKRTRVPFQDVDELGQPVQAFVERVTGHYFNLDKLKEKLSTGTEIKEEVAGETQTREQSALTPMKKAKVQHYYGRFDKGDGKDADYIIAIAEEDLVIRCDVSDLPERPFIVTRYIPIEGQTYGLGMLEILRVSQTITSDVINQYVDNATMILCSMFKRRAGCGITDDMLKFTPFGVIDMEDMDDLQPLEVPHVTKTAIEMATFMHERQRSSVGVYDVLTSTPMSYDQTATEVNMMKNEALARIVIGAINIEEELVSPLLQRIIEFNFHFMGDKKLVRITGNEADANKFEPVTAEDLAHKWDYTTQGASNFQRKMQQRQDWQGFMEQVKGTLAVPPEIVMLLEDKGFDFAALIKEIAKTYDLPNMDKVYNPAAAVQQPASPQPGNGEAPDELMAAIQQVTGGVGV